LPTQDEEDEDNSSIFSSMTSSINNSISQEPAAVDALKQRLTPTLQLPDPMQKTDLKKKTTTEKRPGAHYFRFFRDNPSRSGSEFRRTLHPSSAMVASSAVSLHTPSRPPSVRSTSNMSASVTSAETERTAKRFALYRTGTNRPGTGDRKPSKKERSDDLTEMMTRASNYMTLAYVKIPSMVLCLSYKGKGQRNFEDVHDLVFKMPTLEYRNKTWSNLDLALQLKKDVMRALISHAGAIVGNKFSRAGRPGRKEQSRLRQIANNSTVLTASPDLSGTDSNSMRDHSPSSDVSGSDIPRRSFTSGRQASVISTVSEESSMQSSRPTTNRAQSTHGSIMGHHAQLNALGLEGMEDGRTFADELSRVDNTEPVHANLIHSLSKHFTQVAPFSGHIRARAASGGASMREGSVVGGGEEESDG
jgi:hypothetical protein